LGEKHFSAVKNHAYASIEPDVPRMIVLHKFILFWLKKWKWQQAEFVYNISVCSKLTCCLLHFF